MKSKNYKLPGLPRIGANPKRAASKTARAKSAGKQRAFAGADNVRSINLGHPPKASSNHSQPGSQWSNLLKSAGSSGIAGSLGAGSGVGGGIGSLISGLASLFGGGQKADPPALVQFQLPASERKIITIGGSRPNPGSYSGSVAAVAFENPNTQIVQAVRQALLNSSSLNDVIAEL